MFISKKTYNKYITKKLAETWHSAEKKVKNVKNLIKVVSRKVNDKIKEMKEIEENITRKWNIISMFHGIKVLPKLMFIIAFNREILALELY